MGGFISINIGIKPTVLVGGVPCLKTEQTVDDLEVRCLTPPGRGLRSVTVEIDGVTSVASHRNPTKFFFIPPVVEGAYLEDPRVLMNVTKVNTTTNETINVTVGPKPLESLPVYGGAEFFITGKYFGTEPSDNPIATVGKRPCKKTEWISDALVKCTSPPERGENVKIGLMIGASVNKNSTAPSVTMKYPTITKLVMNSGPQIGGDSIAVHGKWLGGYDVKKEEVVVTLSGVPCKKTIPISSTKVLCRTAPGFGRAAVGVVVREYRSVETNLTTAPVNATG